MRGGPNNGASVGACCGISPPVHGSAARGAFITFEGGEGTGKSTQILLLKARLEAGGVRVLALREPGATRVGERIRAILSDPASEGIDPLAELLLFEAARAQLVREVVRPALEAGATVLCDRFTDSSVAYQGEGRSLGLALVRQQNELACGGLEPDRTIILVRDVEEGLRKAAEKGPDRMEQEGSQFHKRVQAAFLRIAAQEPARVRLVPVAEDKAQTAEQVFEQVADLFSGLAGRSGQSGFEVTEELLAEARQARDAWQKQCVAPGCNISAQACLSGSLETGEQL
jgi:dTMP kinase